MRFLLLVALSLSIFSCSDSTQTQICEDDELYDQLNDVCVPRGRPTNNTGNPDLDMDDASDAEIDTNNDNVDSGPDIITNPLNNIPLECDRDRDGSLNAMCGGADCDDDDPLRSPLLFEFCDNIDNNCSGVVNDGIDCTFFAHSGQTLYLIDPFAMTLEEVATQLPNLQDIDTHPDGTLYGVTFSGLYRFDETDSSWDLVGDFGIEVADPNGMAIDFDGTIFVTAQDDIFTINRQTGAATKLGELGGDFYSSGDCVVDKYDTLFMTSKHDPTQDHLTRIDRATGVATSIGPMGFDRVFGLTAAWGKLYGLTREGELIQIDERTGASTLLHVFDGVRFFGAASTPDR